MANRNMTWQRNLGRIATGVGLVQVAKLTATGEILNYIDFADPLNEMAFCLASFSLGVVLIYMGVPQRHWNKLNIFKK